MAVRFVVLILLPLIVLAMPTVLGLLETNAEQVRQVREYQDDGYRYVIGLVQPPEHEKWAPVLGKAARAWSQTRLGTTASFSPELERAEAAFGEWKGLMEGRGWSANLRTDVPTFPGGQAGATSAWLSILAIEGEIRPVLVLDADDIFVKGYELDVGTVLYRRRHFDGASTGFVVELAEHDESPGARPR